MWKVGKKKIYKIILINHGKYKQRLETDSTETKIYKKFNKLIEESKKVIFPMRYNNEAHVMVESEHEIVIVKCKQPGDSDVNKIRDEYGKYVNYESDDDNWIIIDRAPYYIEETFWVYGYHPKIQRKTFMWIFENFILKDSKNKYMFKSVQVYANKVLIDCNGKYEMVICKNRSDTIRLYNTLEEYARKHKCKYVAFLGAVGRNHVTDTLDRLQKMTGWSRLKLKRNTTRP